MAHQPIRTTTSGVASWYGYAATLETRETETDGEATADRVMKYFNLSSVYLL